jgi:hypothetical protein
MEPTKPAISKWLWIILIVVAVIAAGFFSWYFLMGPGKKTASTSTTTTSSKTTPTASSTTADWLTYTNSTYKYTIKYPKTLSYTEKDGTRNVYFQTAAEKAALTDCSTREGTECSVGKNIQITVDTTAGTTNDETGKTLAEIVVMREKGLLSDAVATTLGGQPAYEGIQSGLVTSYNLFTTHNSHVYDLFIDCDSGTFTVCKGTITSDQQKMIDSFSFF